MLNTILRKFSVPLLVTATVMTLSIASAPRANALIMTLDDLSTAWVDVIIVDNAGDGTSTPKGPSTIADGSGVEGTVLFDGSVGSFIVNVTTGVSKPVVGTPNWARLELNSITVSGGAGDLEIMLTDTDFLPLNHQDTEGVVLTNAWVGTTLGTVTAQGFVDPGNSYFGMGYTTGSQELIGPGGFLDTVSILTPAFPGVGEFSLTETVLIHHGSAGMVTAFNKTLSAQPIPEPATMLLLGIGMVALAGLGKRTRRC